MENITKIEFTGSQKELEMLLVHLETLDKDKLPKMRVLTDRDIMADKLSEMVSDGNVYESLDKLEKQSEINGNVMADDVVTMWQPLENMYSVDELLEEISLLI